MTPGRRVQGKCNGKQSCSVSASNPSCKTYSYLHKNGVQSFSSLKWCAELSILPVGNSLSVLLKSEKKTHWGGNGFSQNLNTSKFQALE